MTVVCLVIRPEYQNGVWGALPRLAGGVEQLARLLEDHDVAVSRLPTGEVGHTLRAIKATVGDGALLVYVGGHGLVEAGEHYTAFDGTPATPDSLDALWTRQLAGLLASPDRDVVLLVDTCFAGRSALMLDQALAVLASTTTSASFGVIAACRAFETAEDGLFVEALLTLLREGPSTT